MDVEITGREFAKIICKAAGGILFQAVRLFDRACRSAKPAIIILAYHRIIPDRAGGIHSYLSVRRSALHEQLTFYRRRFRVISLHEAVNRLRNGQVDQHYLVVTFDDGYRDNFTLGLDLFLGEAVVPSIFLTTDCVERQRPLWPDEVRSMIYSAPLPSPVLLRSPPLRVTDTVSSRIKAVKAVISFLKGVDPDRRNQYLAEMEKLFSTGPKTDRLMMNWQEVRELERRGITIGSHTCSHAILSGLPDRQVIRELRESKAVIEEKTGAAVDFFAYPNGTASDFDESTIQHLKAASYGAALTTIPGVSRSFCDLFRLRRVGVYLTDSLPDIKLKLATALLS